MRIPKKLLNEPGPREGRTEQVMSGPTPQEVKFMKVDREMREKEERLQKSRSGDDFVRRIRSL